MPIDVRVTLQQKISLKKRREHWKREAHEEVLDILRL